MKKKLMSFLYFIIVIAAIAIAVIVTKNFSVESIMRGKEEAVTLSMTEGGLPEDYIGMPAADDIPRIEDIQTWDDTWQTSYVTIEPIGIIPTGIGSRNPWIDAYSTGRRGRSRYRPDVTKTSLDFFGEYAEYYLLELPDESYILAQMSVDDAGKLKAGQSITLPIGRKSSVYQQALTEMADLCEEYDVYTEGVFYCINDKWNESHSFTLLLIRFGIGALITLVIGTVLITIVDKIFKVKD